MKHLGSALGIASVLVACGFVALLWDSGQVEDVGQGAQDQRTADEFDRRAPVGAPGVAPTMKSPAPLPPAEVLPDAAPGPAAQNPPTVESAKPPSKNFLDLLSPNVLQLMEQADEVDRMQELFGLLEELPEPEVLDRIVMLLIESKRQHAARTQAFESEPWSRDDRDSRLERAARGAALEKQYRDEQRNGLRAYLSPEAYQSVVEQWSELSGEEDG